jgi:protein MpaA
LPIVVAICRQRRATLVAAVAAGALAVAACGAHAAHRHARAAAAAAPPAAVAGQSVRVGTSVLGRRIVARVVGDPFAARRVLLVGCLHGDETAGIAITRALRTATPPAGTALWLVDAFNPDGCFAAHTRQNARGVDLNRNAPRRWRRLTGIFDSGPRPLSEPESRAIHGLVLRLRPAITIWYHQHAALVDDSGGDRAVERRYARAVGLPFRRYLRPPGSITSWQNVTFPGATAFVVELPAGRLPAAAVARHAGAVLALTPAS